MEKEEHIKFTEHLEIHVLELPKVQLTEELTDKDLLTKWMLFLSGEFMHTEGFPVETIARIIKMPEEKVLSIISQI